jgi:hypothetical protein
MAFRRKQNPVDLDKILDQYQATTPVAAPPSAVASIRCWKCNRPNVFDGRRRPPSRCVWCRMNLQ